MSVTSPYIFYVGLSAYDLRKVSGAYANSDPTLINVRFIDNPHTFVVFIKADFEAAWQDALDAAAAVTAIGGAIGPGQVAFGLAANAIAGSSNLTWNGTELIVDGKLTVTGLIDPTGLAITPVAANPGGALVASTLWTRTSDSRMMYGSKGASDLATISIIAPLEGSTHTIPNGVQRVLFRNGASRTAVTLVLPSNPTDGMTLTVVADSTVTVVSMTFTVTGTQTKDFTVMSISPTNSFSVFYLAATDKWYSERPYVLA